jgi:hypothetical protein
VQLLGVQQPAQVVDAVLELLGGEQVRLVEDDGQNLGVAGSGTRNRRCTAASAYFCGSSTQIIRSASSTSWSTWSVAWDRTESWSGRSSRTRPAIDCSPLSSALARA